MLMRYVIPSILLPLFALYGAYQLGKWNAQDAYARDRLEQAHRLAVADLKIVALTREIADLTTLHENKLNEFADAIQADPNGGDHCLDPERLRAIRDVWAGD